MGLPDSPSTPHLYPQALQLKLYQAFIFSIPILFSIILFLLFYLFYLKRRASSLSSPSPIIPRTLNQAASLTLSSCEVDLKGKLIEKLPKVLFDEDLRARDSQCCVCLGEFEMKEELIQVPSCKHIFHVNCINLWFCSNSTCPLCRCSVIPTIATTTKLDINNSEPPSGPGEQLQQNTIHNPYQSLQIGSSEQEEEEEEEEEEQQQQHQNHNHLVGDNSNAAFSWREEQVMIRVEDTSLSSDSSTRLRSSSRMIELSFCLENNTDFQDREQVVVHIQTLNS